MSETTKIEWCDSTFNPWIGCTKVSVAAQGGGGCDGCYAHVAAPVRVLRGRGHETFGPGAPRQRTSADYWKQPLRWNAGAAEFKAQHGRRRRVFCASLADVFDNEVDPQWRDDLWTLIRATPAIDWLLLTKRIGNAARMLPCSPDSFGTALPNVWLGATVVNQAEVDRDVPKLLKIYAAQWFLSIEPMLGPITLRRFLGQGFGPAPTWVIAGGESGPQARPADPDWFRSLRDECGAVGVPLLFKQWGEHAPARTSGPPLVSDVLGHGDRPVRVGKKTAGRLLDGVEHNGFPRSCA